MPRAFGPLRANTAVEHFVRVEHVAYRTKLPWSYAVVTRSGAQQAGACASREEAYACALSTLRGMIALERIRSLSR